MTAMGRGRTGGRRRGAPSSAAFRVVGGVSLALAAAMTAACAEPGSDLDALRAELVALHEASVEAHLRGDAGFFAEDLVEDYVVVSGAEIVRPTAEEVRQQFESYLSSTEFQRYETTDGPIVGVSDDGSVGWIITAVEVEGTVADGSPLAFRSAWLSLYRRVDGQSWSMVANVSNVVARE